MQHLLIFESYIDRLDEINFSDHWLERTSLKDPLSRTVPYDQDYQFGFRVTGFLDNNNNIIGVMDAPKMLGTEAKVLEKYISKALNILTNNKELKAWIPTKKEPIQILDLGRICFYKDGIELYPILKAGKGPDYPGFYEGGETIWGLVKENIEGITIL